MLKEQVYPMTKFKTVIVDDEPLARERIRTLLDDEEEFEVAAECENGHKAIEAIESLAPDLVFLDVQMPEVDGFDVLMSLDMDELPAVIFVTAYDQYAVRAFDVHALDYLLKPFDRERFRDALSRFRSQAEKPETHTNALHKDLSDLLDEVRKERRSLNRLLVKSSGRIIFLTTDEVDWVEAAGNYMRIHVGQETFLMRETMAGMEKRLPEDRFVRIHRSSIVNFARIKELQPAFNGEYTVILKTGQELKLSRKYRSGLEKHIGKSL
jgi:two-component system LytT family response regulator